MSLFIHLSLGFERIVRLLFEKGANLNAVNKDNDSALICAAGLGNMNIVLLLIENGADINAVNSQNISALLFATNSGQGNIVRLLLENKVNVGATDNNGNSNLKTAILLIHENIELIFLFVIYLCLQVIQHYIWHSNQIIQKVYLVLILFHPMSSLKLLVSHIQKSERCAPVFDAFNLITLCTTAREIS